MSGITGLGYLAMYAKNMSVMKDFYTRILGMKIVNDNGDDLYLASRSGSGRFQIIMSASDKPTNTQQISFTMGSLVDLREMYRNIKAEGCKIEFVTSHGNAVACYFRDPEDNVLEVYWPTGIDYPQPAGDPVDLEATDEEIMKLVADMPARSSDMPRLYGRDVGKRLAQTQDA